MPVTPLPYILLFTKAKPLNPLIFFLCIYFKEKLYTTSVDKITCMTEYKMTYSRITATCFRLRDGHPLSLWSVARTAVAAISRPVIAQCCVSEEGLFPGCVHSMSIPQVSHVMTLVFDLFDSCCWTRISFTYPSHCNPWVYLWFHIRTKNPTQSLSLESGSSILCLLSLVMRCTCHYSLWLSPVHPSALCLCPGLVPEQLFLICPSLRSTALFTLLGRQWV